VSSTPDTNQPAGQSPTDSYTGMPTWVKWTLLAVLALIVVLVVARFVVGGEHGPGRHMSAPANTAAAMLHGR
jgi:hypothetical protein